MAALDFPLNPTPYQTYLGDNGVTYTWDGFVWVVPSGGGGGGRPTGPAGGDLVGTYPNPFIRNDAVTREHLQDGAINHDKLAAGAVNFPAIGNGEVGRIKLSADVWPNPIPAGADVGKVLTVKTGPVLGWAVPVLSGVASGDISGTYPGPITVVKAAGAFTVATELQTSTLTVAGRATLGIAPVNPLDAATKQYVDGKVAAGAPPTGPATGTLTGFYPNPGVNYNLIANRPVIPTTLPPSGTASGDLSGVYPNPTVIKAALDFTVARDMAVNRNLWVVGDEIVTTLTVTNLQSHGIRCWDALGNRYSNVINFHWPGAGGVQLSVDSTYLGVINVTPPSDARLKLAVQEDCPGLDAVLALRPITFEYDHTQQTIGLAPGRLYGLIAQEAQPSVPAAVQADTSPEQYLSLDYRMLVPVLIQAIHDLAARVVALETPA